MLVGRDGVPPSSREDLMGDLLGFDVSAEAAGAIVEAREARWWEPAPPVPGPAVALVRLTREDVKAYSREEVGAWAREVLGMSDADAAHVSKFRGGILVNIKLSQVEAWPVADTAKAALRRALQEEDWGTVARPLGPSS